MVTLTATLDCPLMASVTTIKDTVSLEGTPSVGVSKSMRVSIGNKGNTFLKISWNRLPSA